jgi:Tol biopolymer transport system component
MSGAPQCAPASIAPTMNPINGRYAMKVQQFSPATSKRPAERAATRRFGRTAFVVVGLFFAALGVPSRVVATTPGENGLIAFTSSTVSGLQLFTVRPNGKDLRQITHVAGDATNVDWSPDGRRLVFAIGTETSASIAVARADGSRLRVLPQPDGVFDDQPSFSPDGQRIYFERFTVATNDDAIWTMTTDGSDQRRILGPFPNGFVTDPNISPDGKTISFQGSDGSVVGPPPNLEPARGLFTADLNGDNITQIRPFTSDQTIKADWAPNGRRIAVTENANHFNPNDSANIVTMRPDGSDLRKLTNFHDGVTNAVFGSYSPDGLWIVFRLVAHGLFGLYRMHPDGSELQAILPLSSFRPSLIDWGAHPDDHD